MVIAVDHQLRSYFVDLIEKVYIIQLQVPEQLRQLLKNQMILYFSLIWHDLERNYFKIIYKIDNKN